MQRTVRVFFLVCFLEAIVLLAKGEMEMEQTRNEKTKGGHLEQEKEWDSMKCRQLSFVFFFFSGRFGPRN